MPPGPAVPGGPSGIPGGMPGGQPGAPGGQGGPEASLYRTIAAAAVEAVIG